MSIGYGHFNDSLRHQKATAAYGPLRTCMIGGLSTGARNDPHDKRPRRNTPRPCGSG